jgi:heme exporter protein CcmD
MAEFLYMDGYWAFVWSSWALTLVVMAGMAVAARRHHRNALREAQLAPQRTTAGRVAVKELQQ